MAQFLPYADRPHLSMNYYETPADVLEDAAELVSWARRSVAVAMKAPRPGVKAPQPSVKAPRREKLAALPRDRGRPRRER